MTGVPVEANARSLCTERAVEMLRHASLRVSARRLVVLSEVLHAPHSTRHVVTSAVRRELGSVSRRDVYDALYALCDAGLVRAVEISGRPVCYEAQIYEDHDHAVCRICGALTGIDRAPGSSDYPDPSRARGFTIDEVEVIYKGLCPDCSVRG